MGTKEKQMRKEHVHITFMQLKTTLYVKTLLCVFASYGKKKSILNTYLKMFLNKCLLFKELQLHLKQLSTRKAKLCWHRPFSSTAFARLSYTESRAGLLFLSMGDAKHGFASWMVCLHLHWSKALFQVTPRDKRANPKSCIYTHRRTSIHLAIRNKSIYAAWNQLHRTIRASVHSC